MSAFRKFDKDRSGHITPAEFKEAVASIGMTVSEERFAQLIKAFDVPPSSSPPARR